MKKILTLIILVSITALSVTAQSNGDYRSASSGLWKSTSTWEKFASNSWTSASSIPNSSNNVTIRTGHVVTLNEGGSASISNLTIEKGAQLNSGATFPGAYSLRIGSSGKAGEAANTGILKNDGILGSIKDSTFTISLDIPLQCANFKLTGNGITQILSLRPLPGNPNNLNVEIDQNVNFMRNNIVFSAYVNNQNNTTNENVAFTINKDKIVKFLNPSAAFHLGGNKPTNPGGNYTYNILGTLDMSETTKTCAFIPVATSPNSITTLNVSGLLKLGSGFIVDSPEINEQNGKVSLNILGGGIVDATLLKGKPTLTASKFQIAPTGTFKAK